MWGYTLDNDIILLDRLVSNLDINLDLIMQWNKGDPIKKESIYLAQKEGAEPEPTPFGHMHYNNDIKERSNDWHIRRILYFMEYPEFIKNIELDNQCYGMYISPKVVLIDGWHRLIAAILLKLEYIQVQYGGRLDLLKYLSGDTDIEPLE